MALEAVSHRIIVRPDPVQKTSKGGIALALDERMEMNASTTGVIISVGEDAWSAFRPKREFAGLKVGDRVYYAKYAGKWVRDQGSLEELLVLQDEDIVAKEVDNVASELAPS